MLEPLGFIMRLGPVKADDFREKFFGKLVAHGEMVRHAAALSREGDAAAALDTKQAVARHALQRRRYGRRCDAQLLRQARADRLMLFLDHLPDGLQVVFARDAGFFARHESPLQGSDLSFSKCADPTRSMRSWFVRRSFSSDLRQQINSRASESVWQLENHCGSWLYPRRKRCEISTALAAEVLIWQFSHRVFSTGPAGLESPPILVHSCRT